MGGAKKGVPAQSWRQTQTRAGHLGVSLYNTDDDRAVGVHASAGKPGSDRDLAGTILLACSHVAEVRGVALSSVVPKPVCVSTQPVSAGG